MIALLATAAAVLGLVIVATSVGANSAGFAITAILLGFGLAPFAGDSLERHVPRSLWDRLSLSHNAYRRLSLPPLQLPSLRSRLEPADHRTARRAIR